MRADERQARGDDLLGSAIARVMFQSSQDCLAVLDADGRVLQLKPAAVRVLELDAAASMAGERWSAVWPEGERPQLGQALELACVGQPVTFQAHCPTRSGKPKWWDVTVSRLSEKDGPAAFLCAMHEITDLAAARPAILTIDDKGVVTTWNHQAQVVFGWTPQEAVGREVFGFILPEREGLTRAERLRHATSMEGDSWLGRALETTALRSTGEEFPVEILLAAVPSADGLRTMAVIQDISARKAETELFELTFENAPNGKAVVALDGRFIKVNRAFCDLVGYASADLLARGFQAITHPDDLAGDVANVQRLLDGEASDYQMEKRYIRADGREVRVELSVSMIRHGDGRPKHLFAQVLDLTDRRQAEQRYRMLAENTSDIVSLHGPGGVFLYASPAIEAGLGYRPEEVIGLTPADLAPPEDREVLRRNIAASFDAGAAQSIHVRPMVHKDGRVIWFETAVRRFHDDRLGPMVITVARDVTERREQERRFRLIGENTSDMIVTTSLGRLLTYVSPSVQALGGWSPAELVGKPPSVFVHPDDMGVLRDAFDRVERGGEGVRVRWRGLRKDGGWVWVESSPVLLAPGPHEEAQFLDVVRDVTAQVAQEEALAKATHAAEAAAAAKADFLANMSHELRTPLTAVLGFAGLLRERQGLDDESRRYVSRIDAASRGLLGLVNDVLDFSKLEAGQFEIRPRPASPYEVAEESLAILSTQAQAKGLELALDGGLDPAFLVRIDPDRLRQVLFNLVGNAVKFTDAGRVRVALSWSDGRLGVAVSDTGPGMSADQQARLFQRFTQLDSSSTKRHGGTGLGLAICKGLVEAMGGALRVRSRAGRGSTFSFEIAAAACGLGEAAAGPLSDQLMQGLRVLVADDNPVNRELARRVFEGWGAEVSEAGDGAEAVDAAAVQPFDVVLLDLNMPRMDGRAALEAIRAAPGPNQDTPIIAFSAALDGRTSLEGFDAVALKPLDARQLVGAVAACFQPVAAADVMPEAVRG